MCARRIITCALAWRHSGERRARGRWLLSPPPEVWAEEFRHRSLTSQERSYGCQGGEHHHFYAILYFGHLVLCLSGEQQLKNEERKKERESALVLSEELSFVSSLSLFCVSSASAVSFATASFCFATPFFSFLSFSFSFCCFSCGSLSTSIGSGLFSAAFACSQRGEDN